MRRILTNIFHHSGFNTTIRTDEIMFAKKEKQEYFFVTSYTEDELEDFFTGEKTDHIISMQDELYEENEDIKKNTSLIIYVKTNNLEEFINRNKKIIYKIEEDEYYF